MGFTGKRRVNKCRSVNPPNTQHNQNLKHSGSSAVDKTIDGCSRCSRCSRCSPQFCHIFFKPNEQLLCVVRT